MKRRSFLQVLLGVPAVTVATPVVAERFPKGLLPDEPVLKRVAENPDDFDCQTMCSTAFKWQPIYVRDLKR